jgi:hypothetical protein
MPKFIYGNILTKQKNSTFLSCSIRVVDKPTYDQNAITNYTYTIDNTPLLFSSTPVRGGTGGGTLISITGMNFPNGQGLIVVTIAGMTCRIVKVLSDLIQCRTAPLTNNYYSSIRVPIVVFIQNQGFALNQVSRNFLFLF